MSDFDSAPVLSESDHRTAPRKEFLSEPALTNRIAQHTEPFCSCLGVVDDRMNLVPRFALSLSGCGFLGVYHFGSVVCLRKHGRKILDRCDRFAGASAGSLVAAMLVTCPDKLQDSLTAWYTLAEEVIQKPFGALTADYSLIDRIEEFINGILPPDAHEMATGRLFVSVTCRNTRVNSTLSEFSSRENLIKYLVGSCYIPFYAGSTLPPSIDGKEYVDGGLSINLPKFTDRQTVTVSPFTGEADISPEDGRTMFDWRVTVANQVVKLSMGNVRRGMQALFPPNLRILQEYYTLGYIDTMKFLMQHRYFERDEGSSV